MSNEIFKIDFNISGEELSSLESVDVLLTPAIGKTKGCLNRLPDIEYIDNYDKISVSVVIKKSKG